jgi:hypothetical protein
MVSQKGLHAASLNKITVSRVSSGNNALELDLTRPMYQKTVERDTDNLATMRE